MNLLEFNREYLIKAANPHDAFYLLTPHMMEHIQKLSKRFEGIAIHAFGNKIAFALRNGNTNSFDPKKWYKKISYQEEIYNVYNEIEDIKSIISTSRESLVRPSKCPEMTFFLAQDAQASSAPAATR